MSENGTIVPTAGRIVLCHGVSKCGPIPGMIVHAWGTTPNSCVNVVAQGDGANEPLQTAMSSVYVYPPDAVPANHAEQYCTWMPFQKGQAVKTEMLEARLESRASMPPELVAGINGALAEVRSLVKFMNGFLQGALPELLSQITK